MAERSFAGELNKLRAGEGDIVRGEGILAITKATASVRCFLRGWLSGHPDFTPNGRA